MPNWNAIACWLWTLWWIYQGFTTHRTFPAFSLALGCLLLLSDSGSVWVSPSLRVLRPYGAFQTLLGLTFAVWASRAKSGASSGLIRSGPYRWVRHPIAGGLLAAMAGSALCQGKVSGLASLLLTSVMLGLRVYQQELKLHRRFGAQYQAYCRETGLLLPWDRSAR